MNLLFIVVSITGYKIVLLLSIFFLGGISKAPSEKSTSASDTKIGKERERH